MYHVLQMKYWRNMKMESLVLSCGLHGGVVVGAVKSWQDHFMPSAAVQGSRSGDYGILKLRVAIRKIKLLQHLQAA
jgi:hypothetical protein